MDNVTILAVDDEPINLWLLSQMLQTKYVIRVATDGYQALKRACVCPIPDLILLDIMMPGMDGFETCRRLKENPETKDIPIIFLTAKRLTDDIVKGFQLGAVDYLTKPFNREELLVRINTHLELKFSYEKISIQNQELNKAAELREDIDRIIRHDMKTPLTSIITLPEILLEEETLSEKGRQYIKWIEKTGYCLLNMINMSFYLLKMEKGAYQLNPVSVDILKILDRVLKEIETVLDLYEVNLKIRVSGKPRKDKETFFVLGEELLFHSMLLNLVKNAVEASPGKSDVEIDLDADEMIRIKIHNQGAVPEEIQDTFFEKYITSGKPNGTGLGTYSAKLMAQTLNGEIRLETSKEKETTIILSFPVPASAIKTSSSSSPPPPSLSL